MDSSNSLHFGNSMMTMTAASGLDHMCNAFAAYLIRKNCTEKAYKSTGRASFGSQLNRKNSLWMKGWRFSIYLFSSRIPFRTELLQPIYFIILFRVPNNNEIKKETETTTKRNKKKKWNKMERAREREREINTFVCINFAFRRRCLSSTSSPSSGLSFVVRCQRLYCTKWHSVVAVLC